MDLNYPNKKRNILKFQKKVFPISNLNEKINLAKPTPIISIKSTIELVKQSKLKMFWLFVDIISIIINIGLLVYFVVVKYRVYKNINDNPKKLSESELLNTIIFDLEKSISIYSLLSFIYFIQFIAELIKNYNNKLNYSNQKFYWFNIIFLAVSCLYSISLLIVDTQYLKDFKEVKNNNQNNLPNIGPNYYIFLLIISILAVIFSIIGFWHDIWKVFQ